jgi:hypothetical protein
MKKIKLFKTIFLLIALTLSYNVSAECDKSDDFDTFLDLASTATAFAGQNTEANVIKTTTGGWICEKALVVQGGGASGSTTNRTKYRPIELGEKGIDIWGDLSNIGTITSPLLSNGCASISFNYASRGAGQRRQLELSIEKNDNIVWRDTLDVVVPASATKYTYTKGNVNIGGDFQLKIINLDDEHYLSC